MPRGEHLADYNKKRAADHASLEMPLEESSDTPLNLGPTEFQETDPVPEVPLPNPEMEHLRKVNLELMEQLNALRTERGQTIFSPAKPIIAKPLPPNYVVWLGPEPPEDVPLCFSAKGRVRCIPKREEFTMIDGDGLGKKRTVVGTTHGGTTSSYIDNGYTSIEFVQRCPPSHKYAGRLYAEIHCPEFAAWLQLTMGRDREGHQLFIWYLIPQFKSMYEQLKRSNMRRKELETVDVEDVMSHGQEMPTDMAVV